MLVITCSVNAAQNPESSFTMSPRSTIEPLYFWYWGSSSHFLRRTMNDAKWTVWLLEDARLRPIRLRTIRLRTAGRSRNWPKSKLIGRSRTDGVCSVTSFSLFFFCLCLFLLLFFFFFLFLLISLFILFLFCFCFCPQKPELNPKPRTLHPKLSDGPLHWTPPPLDPSSAGQPSARQPSAGQPSAGPPKISLFFFPSPGPPGLHKTTPRKDPKTEKEERKLWREEGKKSAKFWAPTLRASKLRGLHPSGPPPFGASTLRATHFFLVWASTFRGPTLRGPTLCGPKIQHLKIGRSRNWPNSKKKKNWPKSKLAEVDRARLLPFASSITNLFLVSSAAMLDFSMLPSHLLIFWRLKHRSEFLHKFAWLCASSCSECVPQIRPFFFSTQKIEKSGHTLKIGGHNLVWWQSPSSSDVVGVGRIHFHPKTFSSTDTFIQKRFHPMTLSSNDTFIQELCHPMNFSSNDTFIQWHFNQ